MSIIVVAQIACDLAVACDGEVVTGPNRREAARLARSSGWKIGRRSGSKPRYDICPPCQRKPLVDA